MKDDIREGLTIIIPSKQEKFLQQTILDVLKNVEGDIEIFPVLDGYDIPEEEIVIDERVKYLKLEPTSYTKKRQGINLAVSLSKYKFVMSLDAHCMMAPGFDTVLKRDWQEKWVMVPRRHRLDAENWCLQSQVDKRPPIDYEYIIFSQLLNNREGMHGFKWDERTLNSWNTPIDDIIAFQGSCWLMSKDWFIKQRFMDLNYQGWGQEAEEICFETWKNGGRVVVNKNTWYAHLHKGNKYGRMYWMSRDENRRSYAYSYKRWMIDNLDFTISLIKKFPRMPNWPNNWEEMLREEKIKWMQKKQ